MRILLLRNIHNCAACIDIVAGAIEPTSEDSVNIVVWEAGTLTRGNRKGVKSNTTITRRV